jgi:ankyrin repeat protein
MAREDHTYAKKKKNVSVIVSVIENLFEKFPLLGLEILDNLDEQSKYNLQISARSLKFHKIYCYIKINETCYEHTKKWTPLHYAAKNSNLELFKYVFDRATNKNPYDKNRNTPLHLAVQTGTLKPKICRHIIKKIYNIHPINNCGKTPLDLVQPAHSYEQQEIVKLFIGKLLLLDKQKSFR